MDGVDVRGLERVDENSYLDALRGEGGKAAGPVVRRHEVRRYEVERAARLAHRLGQLARQHGVRRRPSQRLRGIVADHAHRRPLEVETPLEKLLDKRPLAHGRDVSGSGRIPLGCAKAPIGVAAITRTRYGVPKTSPLALRFAVMALSP